MTSFFDDNESYTKEATDLDTKVSRLLKPLVKEYVEMGYSTRDIEAVLLSAVNMTCVVERLSGQSKRFKESKVGKKFYEKNNL
jgi:hypothetical protein